MAKMLSELFEKRCNDTQYADCMAGEVRSLAVDHDHRQMVCHVAIMIAPMPRAALDGLGKEIANLYGLTRFSIAPRYRALSPQYIQQLRLDLCHRMPSASGLLAESEWELSADNHLRISMGETARGYFSVALRQMQEQITAETGCPVVVEAVPLAEAQVSQMMKVQKEERAAALREAVQAVPGVCTHQRKE